MTSPTSRWSEPVTAIIDAYLADIDARMAHAGRSESERREVRVALREQLEAELPPDAAPADAERALTLLDPPESFGPQPPADVPAPAPAPAAAGRWPSFSCSSSASVPLKPSGPSVWPNGQRPSSPSKPF